MTAVHNGGGYEIWGCDCEGRLFVWSISSDIHPVFEGELAPVGNQKTDDQYY